MRHCSMRRNTVRDGRECCGGAYGGAVFIDGDSVGEVSESEIVENVARDAFSFPAEGAFFVTNGARLVLTASKVNLNVADGCGGNCFNAAGGATYIYSSSVVEIVNCELLENIVRGGEYANVGTDP